MTRFTNISRKKTLFTAVLFIGVVSIFFVGAPFDLVPDDVSGFALVTLVAEGCCGGGDGPGGNGGDGGGGDGCDFFWNCGPANPPPSDPPERDPDPDPPVCELEVDPTEVYKGDSVTLTWTTKRANKGVSINQGVGDVSKNGSVVVDNITKKTTFTLTAKGKKETVKCKVTVKVKEVPVAPVCSLALAPSNIPYNGNTTLTWSTTNADTVSINQGIGSVSKSGSRTEHNITNDRTYTLTATGNGKTVTCSRTVVVEQRPAPVCSLSLSPTYVDEGRHAVLSWYSQNAVNAWINQGIGSVPLSGSQTVFPHGNTTYTMQVHGLNGEVRNCSASLSVAQRPPHVNITANPKPQPVSYVALRQVPYTGLADNMQVAGIIGGTAVVWSVIGYVLYTRRKSILSILG